VEGGYIQLTISGPSAKISSNSELNGLIDECFVSNYLTDSEDTVTSTIFNNGPL
jgi:hypothetical protein